MSNFSEKEKEILVQADQIKLKKYLEETELKRIKADDVKKSWHDQAMARLRNKLAICSVKSLNIDELVKNFEIAKNIEKQKIEKEIETLGEYKGQCLHMGAKTSIWITSRHDSHGDEIVSCAMCGIEM